MVPKLDGKACICVDLTKFNESVCRDRHILPSVEHTLAQLGGAKVFTRLDANSGFWQIELSKESALLTTFITPFGRFCFNRLTFGITTALEHFQKRMSEILKGLEGVVCMVNDVLVMGGHKKSTTRNWALPWNELHKSKSHSMQRSVTFLRAVSSSWVTIKHQLSSAPILALHDTCLDTIVSADASSYGLGAVLTQKQPDGSWRPVLYASRSLTSTEQRYAQIEKKALALTWACERFEGYLLGMQLHLHTDHKPLVPILRSKNLDTLPAHVHQFRMRLMRYQFTISHVPGKDLHIADTLSRAPTSQSTLTDAQFHWKVDVIHLVTDSLLITEERLLHIRRKQEEDAVCQELKQYCLNGWPESSKVKGFVKLCQPISSEISIQDGLPMRNNRIIIPSQMRQEILERIYTSHQGIHKCREQARQSVWWPGISRQLKDLICSSIVYRKVVECFL